MAAVPSVLVDGGSVLLHTLPVAALLHLVTSGSRSASVNGGIPLLVPLRLSKTPSLKGSVLPAVEIPAGKWTEARVCVHAILTYVKHPMPVDGPAVWVRRLASREHASVVTNATILWRIEDSNVSKIQSSFSYAAPMVRERWRYSKHVPSHSETVCCCVIIICIEF